MTRVPVAGRDVGLVVFAAFVAVQALDGALTYIGVAAHGTELEANPLVRWYMSAIGPGAAMVTVKAFAVGCAVPLHVYALHGTLVGLTLLYLAGAIVPWTVTLWP
jgi:hypothetical protein